MDVAAQLPHAPEPDPLESFIGSGHSGKDQPRSPAQGNQGLSDRRPQCQGPVTLIIGSSNLYMNLNVATSCFGVRSEACT